MLFYEHRMMRQEPGLHAVIAEKTDVPIPTIVAHDFSHDRIDRDYVVMNRMPGAPMSEQPSLSPTAIERVLCEVGRSLRAVHAITVDRHGYLGEHEPMPSQKDWPSAFSIMWHELIDDIEACNGYRPSEALKMRRMLETHLHVFDRPVSAALLHMDVWAQNILCDEQGQLSCLLDWDRALYGDPEIEFAVLDYCGISEPPFWQGYGKVRDTSPEAEIRRTFYLLYEMQKYIVIRKVRNRDAAGADRYRLQSLQLAQSLSN